jgi:soluble lytic murein transglycosylase-like protein
MKIYKLKNKLSARYSCIAILLACSPIAQASWQDTAYQTILKPYVQYRDCIKSASESVGIPEVLLMSVIRQEYGYSGLAKKNNPNVYGVTHDYGVMQINDVRLIDHQSLIPHIKNNGCFNILVGARMISKEITKAEDFWQGVGNYHYNINGKYPIRHSRYVKGVRAKWQEIYDIAKNTQINKKLHK